MECLFQQGGITTFIITKTIIIMSTESKIIVGFAAAALAGVGIGMLLAPYSGTESRDKIRKGTNDIANKLLDMVNTNGQALKTKAGEVIDNARSAYQQAKGHAQEEVSDMVDTAKNAYQQAKGQVREEMGNAKRDLNKAV